MSHHFSRHEHRKQSPRHKEKDTGNKVQEFTRTCKEQDSDSLSPKTTILTIGQNYKLQELHLKMADLC